MFWSRCSGGTGRVDVGVRGKKPSKGKGKKRGNVPIPHLDAGIPAGKVPDSLRKQHV
jgi:hypothetical protein